MARLSWLSLQKRDAVGEANLGSPGGALASCGDALGCHELLQLTGLKHFHHDVAAADEFALHIRSEEHTSELQSLMRISYAVFCLKKKTITPHSTEHQQI